MFTLRLQPLRISLRSNSGCKYSPAQWMQNALLSSLQSKPTPAAQATLRFNDTILISEENKSRCMECMKKMPAIGLKLKKVANEQHFAAVLIALTVDSRNGDVGILYTRRSAKLSRHVRQISFPGGIKDDTDADYIECALRETEEEIGLPRKQIDVWGTGALITPPHTAAIMPVIGVIRDFDINKLVLNEDEVDEAFAIPVAQLVEPSKQYHTQFKSGYSAHVFLIEQDKRIWGITGFLTNIFVRCLMPPERNTVNKWPKFIKPYKATSNVS